TSTFSRCIDTTNLTPPISEQSSVIAKKRRKNKAKQQPNDIILNVNNNNNNKNIKINKQKQTPHQQATFNVILAEDCSDFVV
ncbi:unnamed protein product, partial [Rotaria socialis]